MQSALSLPSPQEHAAWLRNRRRQLLRILSSPEAPSLPRGETLERREERTRIIERVTYSGESGERIPALLLIPRTHRLPLPTVVCLHRQGEDRRIGKSSLATGDGLAAELCARGYIVLLPEVVGYEERTEVPEDLESGRLLIQGCSLAAKTVWEISRALDFLSTRTEVEPGRTGLLGMGKGGMLGWLSAAVEPRLKCVAICWGASTFAAILNGDKPFGPIGWIPGLLNWGDAPEVCSLIAPRPLFFCAARQDPLFPFSGFEEVYWRVKQFYLRLGVQANLEHYILPAAPEADAEVKARVFNWFDRSL